MPSRLAEGPTDDAQCRGQRNVRDHAYTGPAGGLPAGFSFVVLCAMLHAALGTGRDAIPPLVLAEQPADDWGQTGKDQKEPQQQPRCRGAQVRPALEPQHEADQCEDERHSETEPHGAPSQA